MPVGSEIPEDLGYGQQLHTDACGWEQPLLLRRAASRAHHFADTALHGVSTAACNGLSQQVCVHQSLLRPKARGDGSSADDATGKCSGSTVRVPKSSCGCFKKGGLARLLLCVCSTAHMPSALAAPAASFTACCLGCTCLFKILHCLLTWLHLFIQRCAYTTTGGVQSRGCTHEGPAACEARQCATILSLQTLPMRGQPGLLISPL